MTTRPLNVLVLAHDASNTGAPLQLLRLLEHWQTTDDVRASVVLRRSGPLRSAYAEQTCFVIGMPRAGEAWRTVTRLKRSLVRVGDSDTAGPAAGPEPPRGQRVFLRMSSVWDNAALVVRRTLRRSHPDVVLANTATHGDIIGRFRSIPVVSYVHERADLLRRDTLPGSVERQLLASSRIAAVSAVVRDDLRDSFGVDPGRLSVVRPFLPPAAERGIDAAHARADLTDRFGLSSGTVIVGGCGSVSWEKGADRFVELAGRVRDQVGPDRPVAFLWLGGSPDPEAITRHEQLARAGGLDGIVRFIGPAATAMPFLAAVDVLALTSRTDAFPLVVVEAASVGTPAVCFAAGGGAREFVRTDAGVVVPDDDLAGMARAVTQLVVDAAFRSCTGLVARARARTELSLERTSTQLLDLLASAATETPRGWGER